MSVTTTSSRSSQPERPGIRTPIAGYSGFVPGMVSLNLHGSSWRDLVLQDPLLRPQTSRPSSARGPFSRQDPEARLAHASLPMRPASARQSERVSKLQQSGRLSAEMIGMTDEFARVPSFESAASFGSRASSSSPRDIENKFMPRMDNHWKPPIVGYGGHVPGYTSGNMHGSAWKVRVKPAPVLLVHLVRKCIEWFTNVLRGSLNPKRRKVLCAHNWGWQTRIASLCALSLNHHGSIPLHFLPVRRSGLWGGL